MQLLRERLIQEGSIITESSVEKLRDKLNRKIIQFTGASNDIEDEIRKSYLNYAMHVIVCRAKDLLSEHELKSFDEKLRYTWMLRFSLLINKLDKFINFSFSIFHANGEWSEHSVRTVQVLFSIEGEYEECAINIAEGS